MEHPTDGRPRALVSMADASFGAAMATIVTSMFMPDVMWPPEPHAVPRPPRAAPCKGRGGRAYASGRFKGSAEAKRATRRGGNPARTRYARPRP